MCFTLLFTSIHFIFCINLTFQCKVTRSSINFHFTPDDGLWFRPKYRITSNITSLFIQPLPFLQLLSGSNRKKLATYIKFFIYNLLLNFIHTHSVKLFLLIYLVNHLKLCGYLLIYSHFNSQLLSKQFKHLMQKYKHIIFS